MEPCFSAYPVLVVEKDELPGCHPLEDGVGLVIGNLLLQLEIREMILYSLFCLQSRPVG